MINILKNFIKRFSFWGVIFLLILILGFKVKFQDILSLCKSDKFYLNYLCTYMIVSIPIYLLMFIWNIYLYMKDSFTLIEAITDELRTNLWTPYRGFCFKSFFDVRTKKGFFKQLFVLLQAIVEMFLWYSIVFFGIINIYNIENNAILLSINKFSNQQIISRILIILGIYLILVIGLTGIAKYDSIKYYQK